MATSKNTDKSGAKKKNRDDSAIGSVGHAVTNVGRAALGTFYKAGDLAGSFNEAVLPINEVKRIAKGEGSRSDYAYTALGALPFLGKAVNTSYRLAKLTALENATRTPLFHGGPPVLKGGKINPAITTESTKLLNQQALNSTMPQQINRHETSINFIKDQLNTPGSFAAQNPRQSAKSLVSQKNSLQQLKNWGTKATKKNYFTAVDDASSTYQQGGAIQVINPKKKDIQQGFGPSGEYQIAGKQKPAATILVKKTGAGSYDAEAVKMARQFADRLVQKNARKILIKETVKNLFK